MEEKIKDIIADILLCEAEAIKTTDFLSRNLGADDLDIVEISMAIEASFEVKMPDNFFDTYKIGEISVELLINIVKSLIEVHTVKKVTEVRPPSKKTIKKRAVKFTEYTYDDGSVTIKPSTKGFNDMELLGLLTYYFDLFKVNMMRGNAKQD